MINEAPIPDNNHSSLPARAGLWRCRDIWYLEKLGHFGREVIPERRMHAKGSGAFGKFTVTHLVSRYTKADMFSEVGKETEVFVRFSLSPENGGCGCRAGYSRLCW